MRLRWVVALGALAVMWTAVPLYKQVKQEWIPSDVDEAEFQATITAPEGTSPESMSKAMLDASLPLETGAGREDVENAMKGHVVAQARIVGTYRK